MAGKMPNPPEGPCAALVYPIPSMQAGHPHHKGRCRLHSQAGRPRHKKLGYTEGMVRVAPRAWQVAYCFRRRTSVARDIRRIAIEQLDAAIRELNASDITREVAIHQARKRIKKIRATLRLVQDDLGTVFTKSNRAMRDAGRALSSARDAAVLVQTMALLREAAQEETDSAAWDRVRDVLATRRDRQAADGDWDHPIGAALPALHHERKRVHGWSISKGFSALAPGLQTIYREGRAAMREASRDGSPASYHAWRKRAKDLWYVARLLRKSARRPMAALCKDLRDLSEVLGKLHDLDVFTETVAGDPELSADYQTLAATVAREREALVSTAHRLGVRIYAERPNAFVRRVEAYWATWRHPAR